MFLSFCKKNWQILVFNFILLLIFIFGYGKFGDIYVDSFREAYIPTQILDGQVLYKDIFTIYAPFSYLFNALLFLVFGIKLKVLYFAGFLTSAGILNILYKISNKFMAKTYGLGLILFVLAVSVLSPNVFNFIYPYSYGILYGLFFVLMSIYFVLNKKFPLAYLMYSFAVCSKYEFVFLLPLICWAEGLSGFKTNWYKDILAFLTPIIIVFLPLFIMGMRVENLVVSIQLLGEMSKTKTLHWFYSISGLIWSWELIPLYIINILKVLIPIILIKKFKNWFVYLAVFVFLYFAVTPAIFIYIFPLVLILSCLRFKSLSQNKRFVILASLLVSLKVFFASNFQSYGVFFLPLGVLALTILLPPKFKKQFFAVLLMISLIAGFQHGLKLSEKTVKISTDRGIMYISPYNKGVKEVIEYIEGKKITDSVLVLPECLAVNFFTNTKTDNKFYSLIPMYVEVFGDEILIQRINNFKPKYIIISDYDTSNYYFSHFGKDYAIGVNDYITSNYELYKTLEGDVTFSIYKINHP